MTALKKSLDRSLSGVEFRPALRHRVLEAAGIEKKRSVRMQRKMSAAVVFALVAALILAGVALAAVITRGFGWYADRYDSPVAKHKLDQLETRSETIAAERDVLIGDGNGEKLRFEVARGYFDGERVDVTYSLIVPDRSADTAWRPSAEELAQMEKMTAGGITDEENFPGMREAMDRDFAQKGVCGVKVHSYFLGDGAWLADGQRIVWDIGEESWEGNALIGYRSYENLPENVRDQVLIGLTMRVKSYDIYYYCDEAGIYFRYQEGETFDLEPVTLTRSATKSWVAQGTADFGHYAIQAEATISPVTVKATVWQRLPEEWVTGDTFERGDDLKSVDYIRDYRLIADGVPLEGEIDGEGYAGTKTASESFSGMDEREEIPEIFRAQEPERLYQFILEYEGVPEGTKEIRLRPVYSLSGERPEEDLVLKTAE